MKQAVIFHSDLPHDIREKPFCKKHAGRMTKIIWAAADANDVKPPFSLDRMDDRIVVRELKPGGAK